MYKIYILSLLLFVTGTSFAQDSTKSKAFKGSSPNIEYPLVKKQQGTYPLMAKYILVKKANEGDPFAEHELGLRYLMGLGFPSDTAEAITWIKKAVDKKVTTARFNFALMHLKGIGVDWNPFTAFELLEYSAEMGMPEAQYSYGIFFTDNLVVNRNYQTAYDWIKKAAGSGLEPAVKALDRFKEMNIDFETGNAGSGKQEPFREDLTSLQDDYRVDYIDFDGTAPGKKDYEKEFEKIVTKEPGELKDALGIKELSGLTEDADTVTAKGLINYAANMGSPEALVLSGMAFEKGFLVEKNSIKAVFNYLRAYRLGSYRAAKNIIDIIGKEGFFKRLKSEIDSGNPDAMYVWAALTALGMEYSTTDEQAVNLLERAADKNHEESLIEMGLNYYNGILTEQNKSKAKEYLRRAAGLGSSEAKIRLALWKLSETDGNLSDDIDFLIRQAESGSVLAQAALGFAYETGAGVKQDKAAAEGYYRKAAGRGNEAAYESLKRMYDDIRPENGIYQIAED